MNMKRTIITSLLALTVFVLLGSDFAAARQSGQIQSEIKPAPTPTPGYPLAPLRRDFKNSFPIPAGEKLEYEVRFSRFPIYASVGIVTFGPNGTRPFVIQSDANTTLLPSTKRTTVLSGA